MQFVLPNGFRGLFTVRELDAGDAPTMRGDTAVFRVPPDGRLLVRRGWVFNTWTRLSVVFEDGTTLTNYKPSMAAGRSDAIYVAALGTSADGEDLNFVGTFQEADYAMRHRGEMRLRVRKNEDQQSVTTRPDTH